MLVNKALTAAGFPVLGSAPPPAQMKLTPAAPTNGGAAIMSMGVGTWTPPSAASPDGSFSIYPSPLEPGEFNPARILMDYPAEVGKMYVLDCRIGITNGQRVKFWGMNNAGLAQVTEEGGHVLFSMRAVQPRQPVSLGTLTQPFTFHGGCEITKVN